MVIRNHVSYLICNHLHHLHENIFSPLLAIQVPIRNCNIFLLFSVQKSNKISRLTAALAGTAHTSKHIWHVYEILYIWMLVTLCLWLSGRIRFIFKQRVYFPSGFGHGRGEERWGVCWVRTGRDTRKHGELQCGRRARSARGNDQRDAGKAAGMTQDSSVWTKSTLNDECEGKERGGNFGPSFGKVECKCIPGPKWSDKKKNNDPKLTN